MNDRRVVVTGLGPITPIGVGKDDFHADQLAGKSGVGPITLFDASEFPTRFAGEISVDFGRWLDRKEMKRMDRFTQFAVAAASLALDDSGLDLEVEDRTRIGTLIGTGIGGMATFEAQARISFEKSPMRVSPFFIPMMIANMASAQVTIRWGLMGPSSTSVLACTSGADALGGAARMLQADEADVVIAGGAEAAITPLTLGGFSVMRALSTRNESPQTASRPFTLSRDGFVLGEGAGVLVLETFEHARARGAHIYAELLGYGRSSDAFHMVETHPEGKGAALAIGAALREARLDPSAVGYINAHGTSTPVGDVSETLAIKSVFGNGAKHVPISSTKSMTGHLLGAAGAIEAIASIQALNSGVLPPTINLHDPDPALDLDFVPNEPRETKVDVVLSNSFAFGGHNGSLAFGKV